MTSIEDIVERLGALPLGTVSRRQVDTLVAERVHLSRGPAGEFSLFMEGALNTFGPLPHYEGISHDDDVVSLPGERRLSVLTINSPDTGSSNRLMAHIAYEVARLLSETPSLSNRSLIRGMDWVLAVLGDSSVTLSTERQSGLLGELLLLKRLMDVAGTRKIEPLAVLERWKGYDNALRDFVARGIAVEVKATGNPTRLHHFGSIEQLDPQDSSEEVYLFSVGVRRDSSAQRTLPDYVIDIQNLLVTPEGVPDEPARSRFRQQLSAYGYESAHERLYRAFAGFRPPHLQAVLFEEKSLDRLRTSSFSAGAPPRMVVRVGYTMDIACEPLGLREAEEVYLRLLQATAVPG